MKDKYIIITVLILIAILFLYRYQENITSDSGKTLSDESLQNIASVYNTQNMTVTNLNASNQANLNNAKVTGNLNVSGTITGNLAGNVTGNVTGSMQSPNGKYILRLHDDGNLVVYDTTNNNQATWDAFTSISTKKEYAIQSSRQGYLSDKGGWTVTKNIDDPYYTYERLRFKEMKNKLKPSDYHWD